jgi:hypothetical protein
MSLCGDDTLLGATINTGKPCFSYTRSSRPWGPAFHQYLILLLLLYLSSREDRRPTVNRASIAGLAINFQSSLLVPQLSSDNKMLDFFGYSICA